MFCYILQYSLIFIACVIVFSLLSYLASSFMTNFQIQLSNLPESLIASVAKASPCDDGSFTDG